MSAPPGITRNKIVNQPTKLNSSEPCSGVPKKSIKINIAKTPEANVRERTKILPYFDIKLPENTVNTDAKMAPKITNIFPIKF